MFRLVFWEIRREFRFGLSCRSFRIDMVLVFRKGVLLRKNGFEGLGASSIGRGIQRRELVIGQVVLESTEECFYEEFRVV